MSNLEHLKEVSNSIVLKLRKQKLDKGQPFLIRSSKLPKNQSYIEYPNHLVKIVIVSSDKRSFDVVQEFNIRQSKDILRELNIY